MGFRQAILRYVIMGGTEFLDMVIGDAAVVDAVKSGNMSVLRVWLAEKLIELSMGRDGEICTIGVKQMQWWIAERLTKTKSLFRNHGWHDWLAVNLGQPAGLDEHLLPGLAPNGVPKI